MNYLILFLLVHAVADYPLQGDFLARGKNHKAPLPGVPWMNCLLWHSIVHAGGVYLVTNSPELFAAELVAHVLIDFGKCHGLYGFITDQVLHVVCKVVWVVILIL